MSRTWQTYPRMGLLAIMLLWAQAATCPGITVDLDYDRPPYEAPSWDPNGRILIAHMEAAAAIWSQIIKDGHEIRVQFQWEQLDTAAAMNISHTSAKHYFDTDGDGHNESSVERVTNCTIKVDPDVAWYVDPTPTDHSEFGPMQQLLYRDMTAAQKSQAYAGSPPDLLEASCDMAPGAGVSGQDLLSTLLHEMGHGLGFTEFCIDVDSPYRLPRQMVWGADVRVHEERGQGDQNRVHIDTPAALMSYNWTSGNRVLPSATDVLAMADFCHWTNIDLPRKDFVHVDGADAYWDHRLNWTGARVPDAEDQVFIRSGVDCIVHWDAEAHSVLVDEDSSLTITGNQVLRLWELEVTSNSLLRLAWSESRVEFVDPSSGDPIPSPSFAMEGSLEMTNNARQRFGRLTIEDHTPGAGASPYLAMEDHAALTVVWELSLLGGAEATLSQADLIFEYEAGSELNLNGQMTLADESTAAVKTLNLLSRDGIAPRLAVHSGSTFAVTDDRETSIPLAGTIEIRNSGSGIAFADDVRVAGALSIDRGGFTARDVTIESGGTLSVVGNGQLDLTALSGMLVIRRDAAVTLSGLGSCILANSLSASSSFSVDGGARIETDHLRFSASGGGGDRTLTLNGVGTVLTVDEFRMQSGHAASAMIDHRSGVVTVGDVFSVHVAEAPSRYALHDGRLTIANDLQLAEESSMVFDLLGGRFEVDRLDIAATAELTINLDGGQMDLGHLPAAGAGPFALNLNGGQITVTAPGVHAFDTVNVASRTWSVVDHIAPSRELTMNRLSVGQRGDGALTLSGPTTIAGSLVIGEHDGARGQLTFSPLNEWDVLEAEQMIIGDQGSGQVTQTNGYVTVDDAQALLIGRGGYRLEGGRLETQATHVGTRPGVDASLTVDGGRHDVGTLLIGMAGRTATCQVQAGRLEADHVMVADGRAGDLVQTDGTVRINHDLVVGNTADRQGRVEHEGGDMTVVGNLQLAAVTGARGTFAHHGGALTVRGNLMIGPGDDSVGQFDGFASLDVLGDLSVGAGLGAAADFRIESVDGVHPTLDVDGGIAIAPSADSRADFYIQGTGGSTGPTVWLSDRNIDVGFGGTGTLHMAGGRIRAVKNLDGQYDSQLAIGPTGSLRGFGQVDIPMHNGGLVFNDVNLGLSLMSKVGGAGVYRTESDPATFQTGRIEFWAGGQITGQIICNGYMAAFGSAVPLSVDAPIVGTGRFQVGGQVETTGDITVARLEVNGDLRQRAGKATPDLFHLDMGTYIIEDGSLETASPFIGGTLEQRGGQILIHDRLTIGPDGGYTAMPGTVVLTDGSLHVAGDLQIGAEDPFGMSGFGTLRFTSNKPHVTVEGDLILTDSATLQTVEGARIELLGSNVITTAIGPTGLAGLSQLTLAFNADGSLLDTLEVAGDPTGSFDDNFAVGRLDLNLNTRLQLVDLFDNGHRSATGAESLFVDQLSIADTASFDLNGLDLFIADTPTAQILNWIADGRLHNGADQLIDVFYDPVRSCTVINAQPIPEPASCFLLLAGLLWMRRDRSP